MAKFKPDPTNPVSNERALTRRHRRAEQEQRVRDERDALRVEVEHLRKWKLDVNKMKERASCKDLASDLVSLQRGFDIRERERDEARRLVDKLRAKIICLRVENNVLRERVDAKYEETE